MKSATDILRPVLCVFSIFLLWLLGTIGEQLLNLPIYRGSEKHMPALTAFFLDNFNINAGHFLLSLTPFMILLAALAACSFDRRLSDLYWYLFVGVWLVALTYLLVFVLALLLPFHLLAVELGDSRIPKIVHAVNIGLIISIVVFLTVMRTKRRKAEPSPAPSGDPATRVGHPEVTEGPSVS